MPTLMIRLFGTATFEREGVPVFGLRSGKFLELFCYLLLQRGRPVARESLANVFWGECTTAQSRKYLRQSVWQLLSLLSTGTSKGECRVLQVEADCIGIHPEREIWLDVEVLERAFCQIQSIWGNDLSEHQVQLCREAVELYRGDLLEGWYQDWCLFHRERLQNQYLAMLDRLMSYCESRGNYEAGLHYGEKVLTLDRAHERTHQRMLRLLHLSGDRVGALRQYERCVDALSKELKVKPSAETRRLYEEVRTDSIENAPGESLAQALRDPANRVSSPLRLPMSEILNRLRGLEEALASAQEQVQRNIRSLEDFMHRPPPPHFPDKRRAV